MHTCRDAAGQRAIELHHGPLFRRGAGVRRADLVRRALAAAMLALAAGGAQAFSLGSPVCEVQAIPLAPMSPTLATPAPTGWQLRIDAPRYIPGQPLRVAVTNADPTQRARGVLLWAKVGPVTGLGSFVVDSELWQHLPGSSNCGEWAITHTSNSAKTLDALHFDWIAPSGATANVLFRAFVIQDCDDPNGCRSYQALTPVKVLQAGLFHDDFEQGD